MNLRRYTCSLQSLLNHHGVLPAKRRTLSQLAAGETLYTFIILLKPKVSYLNLRTSKSSSLKPFRHNQVRNRRAKAEDAAVVWHVKGGYPSPNHCSSHQTSMTPTLKLPVVRLGNGWFYHISVGYGGNSWRTMTSGFRNRRRPRETTKDFPQIITWKHHNRFSKNSHLETPQQSLQAITCKHHSRLRK